MIGAIIKLVTVGLELLSKLISISREKKQKQIVTEADAAVDNAVDNIVRDAGKASTSSGTAGSTTSDK